MEPLRSMEERLLSALLLPSDDAGAAGGFGLGTSVVGVDLLVSLAALATGFFLVRDPGMSRKRQAWILSALSSMTAATLSLPYAMRLLRHGFANTERFVFSDDRLARFLCAFFAAFLLADLGLGLCFYKDQIQLLSGWVHHILYLGLMYWALTSHFTCGFALFLPLELPTFILAMGSIFPQRRSDLLFGASFFATRICYHALLLQRILRLTDAPIPVWIPTVLAFALHIYWFALWCRSYTRRRLQLERGKSSVVSPIDGGVTPSPAGAGMSPTSVKAASAAAAQRGSKDN